MADFSNDNLSFMLENAERMRAELSLIEFTKQAWHTIEPGCDFTCGWAVEAVAEHLQAITEGQIKRLLINIPPGCTKSLAIGTSVLTTHGWKAHGDLRPGDFVYGPDGQPKRVIAVTPHNLQESFRVGFSDKSSLVAGHGHRWLIERDENRTPRQRDIITVTTKELLVKDGDQRPDSVRVTKPINSPPQDLLIDPYLLGAWLGDGNSNDGTIYAQDGDTYALEEFCTIRHTIQPTKENGYNQPFHHLRAPGLCVRLRIMGLRNNKHIPEQYLNASIEQRWALLQGLMDTDGCCTTTGHCRYSSKLQHLSEQVRYLAMSLGLKVSHNSKWAMLNGKRYGPHYYISFTAPAGAKVFRLERKQSRIKKKTNDRISRRYVKSVEPLGRVWVNCIQVEGELYLAGRELVCQKNSMLTNVMWPAWEWGPRGKSYYKYISAGYEQGLSIRDMVRCRDLIKSEWYSSRWPVDFHPAMDLKGYYQNTNTGFRLASSVRGALTGHRGDRIIVDDPHSVKTAESDADREESLRWFTETLPTRLNKQDKSAIVVIMQRLHEDDISGLILSELAEDWTTLILPMEYEKERHCKTSVPVGPDWKPFTDPRTTEDELLWPERFPRESVEELKKTFRAKGGSYAESAQLQQRPAPRGGGLFKRDDFQIIDKPLSGRTVRGWDLAATKKQKSAFTAGCKMTMTDGGIIVIEHMERLKGSPHEVKEAIKSCAEIDGKDTHIDLPQDPGQAGVAQKADLAAWLQGFVFRFSPETGSKEVRAQPLSAQAESGNVFLVRGSWNDAFLNEIALFPAGKYADQADAASRAYAALLKFTTTTIALLPPTLIVGYDNSHD